MTGVTPVDGTPGQPYSCCYPVVLDGAMIGWVEKDLALSLVESLRKFKVEAVAQSLWSYVFSTSAIKQSN